MKESRTNNNEVVYLNHILVELVANIQKSDITTKGKSLKKQTILPIKTIGYKISLTNKIGLACNSHLKK